MPRKDRRLINKIEDARGRELHKLCVAHFKHDNYTTEDAETFLRQAQPQIRTGAEGDTSEGVITDFARAAVLAVRKATYLRKGRNEYAQLKAEQSPAYFKKQYGESNKRRVVERKNVRAKVKANMELTAREELVLKRIKRGQELTHAVPTEARSPEEILRVARGIAMENGNINETDEIVQKLTPFAKASKGQFYDEVRNLKIADRLRRRERDRRHRVRKPKPYKKRTLTAEQHAAWRTYHREYRKKNAAIHRVAGIRNKNRDFGIDHSLDVQCDEISFLRNFSNLRCAYCGICEEIGIDRINSADYYRLSNIVPCCAECNRMKGPLPVATFVRQCSQVCAYQAAKAQFLPSEAVCTYCGMRGKDGKKLGIDRIVPGLSYDLEENCVPCCSTCNYLKGILSQSRFLEKVTKIKDGTKKSVVEVQVLHQQLVREGIMPRPRKGRARASYAVGRDGLDQQVLILCTDRSKAKIYHSKDGTCCYVARSKSKETMQTVSATSAILKGRHPCLVCRKTITAAEMQQLASTNFRARTLKNWKMLLRQRLSCDEVDALVADQANTDEESTDSEQEETETEYTDSENTDLDQEETESDYNDEESTDSEPEKTETQLR